MIIAAKNEIIAARLLVRKSESAYSERPGIAGKCWYWPTVGVVTGKACNQVYLHHVSK